LTGGIVATYAYVILYSMQYMNRNMLKCGHIQGVTGGTDQTSGEYSLC